MIISGGTPKYRKLALICSVALLTMASAPVWAQTAEEQERSYRRETMEQALQTRERYDLYGLHFDSDKATTSGPQYTLLITDWKSDATIPPDAFTFKAADGAKKVEFDSLSAIDEVPPGVIKGSKQ